jgi:short subunit dehydrogenase-like uncharacterized protein
MPGRIVVFGATGYTGRLVAERLAGAGERPVLAGRSEEPLRALAEQLGGLEWAKADVMRQNSVFALVSDGDVLLSTVGPFARWGEPAVRAAISAKAGYVDSTGEPQFIRRVFEQHGPAARSAEVALLPAMGFDFVPGALAGALALRQAGSQAVRVDVGYYSLGGGGLGALSSGTRQSLVGASLNDGYAFREGALRDVRAAERMRSFRVKGKRRTAISIGGAEHFTLPAAFPRLREVNVYLGWFGPLARPMQAGTLIGSVATRLPGVRGALQLAGSRLAALGGSPEPGTTPGGMSWVAAVAYDAFGEQMAEVHLSGVDRYAFTAEFLAWAARSAAAGRVAGTGALGPVEAFGVDTLERGCRQAGLERVVAQTG